MVFPGGAEEVPMSRGAVLIKDPKKRRKCPLCRNNLFLYYLNHDEMFLMCENKLCDFPFGYEPIQIVRDESQLVDNPTPATDELCEYPIGGADGMPATPMGTPTSMTTSTMSAIPSSLISDYDQLSLTGDSDASSIAREETLSERLKKESRKRKEQANINKEIQKSLRSIRRLNEEMNELMDDNKDICSNGIKNEKWLKNLKVWEAHSGKQLLSDTEKTLIKNEPDFASGELKISIDPEGSMPSVNIQILKPES